MTCYHPLKRFELPDINPDTGKHLGKVVSFNVNHLIRMSDSNYFRCCSGSVCAYSDNCISQLCNYGDCYSFDKSKAPPGSQVVTKFTPIPCGQCIGCRIDKSREWANRMLLELPYSDNAYFVTLTYDDEHLPMSEYHDILGLAGEVCDAATLRKKDFQLFMKRLRKRFGEGIRYYAAGEYGSKTFRPHYHAIIYNLPLQDLKLYKVSPRGDKYYNSEELQKVWPFGYVVVADVTWETCAYTARYVTKKLTGKQAYFYDYFNVEPEFSLMSRRPGLGKEWYNEHGAEAYKSYIITVSTQNGMKQFKPPHYYDTLYDQEEPARLKEVKEQQRKMAQQALELKLQKTTLSYLELLAVEESNFKSRVSSLRRDNVPNNE